MYTIANWLSLGTHNEALRPALMESQQIGAVLQLANPTDQLQAPAHYLRVHDATFVLPATIEEGMAFINEQRAWGHRVLIADDNARSCAPMFAIAALKEAHGVSLIEAYRLVLTAHPHAQPHPLLWDSLCTYYPDEPPYGMLWFQINSLLHGQTG
jgi:hypothetical protein